MPPKAAAYRNSSEKDAFCPLSLKDFVENFHSTFFPEPLTPQEKFQQAFEILLQLTEALTAFYQTGFIHGDLHPGNILLTTPAVKKTHGISCPVMVKLIDFDNTNIPKQEDHAVTRLMGAKPFVAPEVLDFSHPLDRTDIYSLGCLLYYMIYECSPKDRTVPATALKNRWFWRIFRRCTASYEARYPNLHSLRRDLLHALSLPATPFGRFIRKIPGFRTHTLWHMLAAGYFYLSITGITIANFADIIQNNFHAEKANLEQFFYTLLLFVLFAVVCDFLDLDNSSRIYHYFRHTHLVLFGLATFLAMFVITLIFLGISVFLFY